jgi:phospholipid N-methyltransferase
MNAKAEILPHAKNKTPDWWLFLNKFLRQGTGIAALAPSSRWLARAVVRGIDFTATRSIVELGAGTGPITGELLRQAPAACRAIVVERDADFCRRLRQRYPQADVVEADANNLEHLLHDRGLETVDHVISGLPLPSFPPELRDGLLNVVHQRLAANGTFRQLTHMPWVYYKLYRRYFAEVDFRLVPMNLPPGGVYICRGPMPLAA